MPIHGWQLGKPPSPIARRRNGAQASADNKLFPLLISVQYQSMRQFIAADPGLW
jgi:hypothetical protein